VQGDTNTADDCGHGTHTAGTVGATTGNALGVAGMSQATILPLRVIAAVGGLLNVQCSGNTSGIATAIRDAADQGAKVISMSIGGGGTATLESAVDYAWGKGVILVAASGNDGGANSVDFPGAYANVVAVGAVQSNKAKASYSDGGPQLDVMGPGTDVLSTYNSSNTSYSLLSGTSMATPHVSGALALALSCAPSTSNAALRDALYATAEDLGAGGRDDVYGNGLARVDQLVASLCGGGGGTTTTSSPTSSSSSSSSSTSSTVSSDPDPGAPTVTSGSTTSLAMSGGQEKFLKINVPAGKAQLKVVMTGPACSLLSCSLDSDLYTRQGARPTNTVYACRPYQTGNNETCTHASPAAGYWYIRVHAYSGSGTVQIKPTIT
jgi:serine protease